MYERAARTSAVSVIIIAKFLTPGQVWSQKEKVVWVLTSTKPSRESTCLEIPWSNMIESNVKFCSIWLFLCIGTTGILAEWYCKYSSIYLLLRAHFQCTNINVLPPIQFRVWVSRTTKWLGRSGSEHPKVIFGQDICLGMRLKCFCMHLKKLFNCYLN